MLAGAVVGTAATSELLVQAVEGFSKSAGVQLLALYMVAAVAFFFLTGNP